MAAKPTGDKTEKPTPKKQKESRKKGMTARSSELPQAISLVVAAILLPMTMPGFFQRMADIWQTAVSPTTITDPAVSMAVFGQLMRESFMVFVPMVIIITGSSIVAQLAMSGGKPNPYKLKPQWANLHPGKGLKRMFSVQILWDFARTLSKLLLLILVTYGLYERTVNRVLGGSRLLEDSLAGLALTLRDLLIRAAAAAVLVGIIDAVFNKKRFLKQIRMTKQEVKEEAKQQESSPHVKTEIRRRQQALSRNRMIAAVSKADVIITNPTHLAIALGYDPDEGAPKVLAKGAGVIAENIRKEARQHGVPIRENKPLARAMYRVVEVDQFIPAEFFAAVAAVLAAVYRTRRRSA